MQQEQKHKQNDDNRQILFQNTVKLTQKSLTTYERKPSAHTSQGVRV